MSEQDTPTPRTTVINCCIDASVNQELRRRLPTYARGMGALISVALADYFARQDERAKCATCHEMTTAQSWEDTGVRTD